MMRCWVLAATFGCVYALFREQLGDFDWIQKNYGFIAKSLIFDNFLIVGTSENVLACLNIESGKLHWRVALSENTQFLKFVMVERNIVISTRQKTFDGDMILTRSWFIDDGTINWDMSIVPSNDDSNVFDLNYNAVDDLLTILSGNSLHFLTVKGTDHSNMHNRTWSWSPRFHSFEESDIGERLFLNSLAVTTSSASITNSKNVAVGCVVSTDEEKVCVKAAIVSLRIQDRAFSVDLRKLGDEFKYVERLKGGGLLPSHDREVDVLFGTSIRDSDVVFSASLTILSLSTGMTSTVTKKLDESRHVVSAETFVLSLSHNVYCPALYWCWDNNSTGVSCEVLVAKRDVDSWHLELASGVSGSDDKSGAALDSAVVALEPLYSNLDVVDKLHSVSVSWDRSATGESILKSIRLVSSEALNNEVAFNIVHPSPIPMSSSDSRSAFRHMAVSTIKRNDDMIVRVLLVLHSGLTMVVEVSSNSTSSSRILWTSDQSLSRIQKVLLVDIEPRSLKGEKLGAASKNQLFSLKDRLVLQFDGLWVNAFDKVASLGTVVHKAIAQDALNAVEVFNSLFVKPTSLSSSGKTAIVLSHSPLLKRTTAAVTFREAGLKITSFSLIEGGGIKVAWSVYPTVGTPLQEAECEITSVDIVTTSVSVVRGVAISTVMLIAETASGDTLLWCFRTDNGKSCSVSTDTTIDDAFPSNVTTTAFSASIIPLSAKILNRNVGNIAFMPLSSSVVDDSSASSGSHMIVHSNATSASSVAITHWSTNIDYKSDYFVHYVDRVSGQLNIYKADSSASCADYEVEGFLAKTLRCSVGELVASVLFPPEIETIVDVAYYNPQDIVNTRSSILGDDSVLLKYLNPNVVLITTVSPPEAAQFDYYSPISGAEQQVDSDIQSTVTVSLVDTVSGRVIKRMVHESASLPVNVVMVENNVVVTYWNVKSKRTELSSSALYEGVIDKYGLGPLASSKARANPASYHTEVYSSYTTSAPLTVQKTYTLSHPVTALAHTVTANGISNKNILMALRNGQVFAVDMRLIHPRRPMAEPTQSEKEEGLMKYNPFILLNPHTALTHNYALSGHGASTIVSAATDRESTSLVMSFGGGVDFHINRALPSQGFDMLASDFNFSLLVVILVCLAISVAWLRRMHLRKQIETIWA